MGTRHIREMLVLSLAAFIAILGPIANAEAAPPASGVTVVFQGVVVGPFSSDIDMSRCARIRLYIQSTAGFASFGLTNLDGPIAMGLDGFSSTFAPSRLLRPTMFQDVPCKCPLPLERLM
jgi:hypothetical protein